MHKKLLIFAVMVSGSLFAQPTQNAPSGIRQVTVFLNNALIEANATTTLPAGRSKVIITEIAGTTDPNSVQVSGKGNFTILGVNYRTNHQSRRETAFSDSLKAIDAQMADVSTDLFVVDSQIGIILKNTSDIKSTQDGLLPAELKEMLDFTRQNLTDLSKRQTALKLKKQKMEERKQQLQQQFNEMGGQQTLGELEITVAADAATKADFNLKYLVNNAGWNPTYDLRAAATEQPIKLDYKANVYQRTGVDWNNVKLVLSTTNPLLNGNKPELQPQYIMEYVPRPVMMRSMKVSAAPAMADAAGMVEEAVANSLSESVEVSESDMTVNFTIAIPYSIPSTGKPEMVEIQQLTIPATYAFTAVPKYSSSVYLMAKLTDWGNLNLLSGPANVYYDGGYVGNTFLNQREVKDTLNVSLGISNKIEVQRKSVTDYKNRRVIGNTIRENFVYETTLRNTKNETVKVLVEEQVPVSQDSRIEVEFTPESGMTFDAETGKVTWTATINPNQSVSKRISYAVKYPKGIQVINL